MQENAADRQQTHVHDHKTLRNRADAFYQRSAVGC